MGDSQIKKKRQLAEEEPTGGEKAGENAADDLKKATSSDYYFDSYSHFGIHEEMLKDEVRTRAYMHAIEDNKHLFKDKIVLDIGCGTGILSMFAARAGAKKVFAIECSTIVEQCKQIVEVNGFSSTIEVIQGKMEDIELPVEKVDIIISEWMGYFLLYESMLDTILYARDKYLVSDGIILPDKAELYLCAIEDADYKKCKIDFWDNVYGFDMSTIKDMALLEPLVDSVDSRAVNSDAQRVLSLDLKTCTKEDCTFSGDFSLTFNRQDYCHAIVAFFECQFTQIHKPIVLSTSPFCPYTHWKQVVFYLKHPLTVCNGEVLEGCIKSSPNIRNARDLDIELNYEFQGRHTQMPLVSQQFRLR